MGCVGRASCTNSAAMSVCWVLGQSGLTKQSVVIIFLLQTKIYRSHQFALIIIEMLNIVRRFGLRPYTFATATRDSINYYEVLELPSGATETAIRQAYADLTASLKPERDTQRFQSLNQAFVILTDSKTRDAYDSLLAVRKSFYLSPEESRAPATRSYLSERKLNREQDLKKRANIDEFGRYRGGLPRRNTELRGSSLGQTGTTYRQVDVEAELNPHPEFNTITAEKAESFKNFHQDERKARTMKWPWFTFQVDYDYFTFKTFRKAYWPKIQLLVLLLYILPTFYYAYDRWDKQQSRRALQQKAHSKADQPHA